MSFLSGLFGRTKYEPTTRTVQTVSKLPEEIAPYVTDILEDAQAQYDKAVAEGYQPYTGETIAPRTQAELDAIAGLRNLIGGQGQYIDEAEAALRGIDTEFTAEQAEKFMSPYQQAVTDIEKRKAEEDFKRRVMPEFERQAVEAGGMSGLGTRAGVQAAMLGEAFSQQLGDIQAKGQQKAYEDAYRQFTDQATRQRAQAEDLRNVGLQRFQTGLAEQGLGQQLAQQDRQEAQNILDKKFLEYLEQEQYPAQQLAQYSGLVYGNPLAKMADTTATTTSMLPPTAPGIGQQLLGLGLSGLNVFGMGGGFSPGGFAAQNLYSGKFKSPLKTGGRIVYRQEGGQTSNMYGDPTALNKSRAHVDMPPLGLGLASLFDRIVPRRQTNVIENIDNAASSLNDYQEAMNENMRNLGRATAGISRTYNQTFGNPLRRFMSGYSPGIEQRSTQFQEQSPGFEQKVNPYLRMKAGGGLGSLPVVKKQQGRAVGSDIRTRSTSPMETLSNFFRKNIEKNRVRDLQRDMANYKGEVPKASPSRSGLLRGPDGKLPSLFSLSGGTGPGLTQLIKSPTSPKPPVTFSQIPTVPKEAVADYIRQQQKEAEQMQKIVDAQGNVSGLDISEGLGQPTTLAQAVAQLPDKPPVSSSKSDVIDSTGLTGLRSKIKSANVDIMNRLLKRAKEIGERRDVDRATFEAMPEANLATRKEILEIKNAGNKRLAAQEAANVTELDKMQKGFADADQKALDDYEKDKIDRLEKARQAWPGAEIAAAIDAGMDEPSLVTMLSKVMNVSVAGISKRTEKINDKMDKLKDVMFEKETELRGKNEQRKLNVLDKKQTNLINSILRDTTFKANLAELPIKQRADVITSIKSLAALDTSKDTTLINIAKVLTDILEETGTGGDANYGIAGGYTLGKLKDISDLLSTACLIPTGDVSSGQVISAAGEIQKIFDEVVRGLHRDKIPWNKAIAAKRGSVLKTQEDIVRIFKDRIQKAMQEPSPTQAKDLPGYNKGKTQGMGRTFSERLSGTAKRVTEEKKEN